MVWGVFLNNFTVSTKHDYSNTQKRLEKHQIIKKIIALLMM